MRFNPVRLAVHDIDVAAIRFPTRNSFGEVRIRICDAPVVLFLELVFQRAGGGSRRVQKDSTN